jgi:hypothetical protein
MYIHVIGTASSVCSGSTQVARRDLHDFQQLISERPRMRLMPPPHQVPALGKFSNTSLRVSLIQERKWTGIVAVYL